MSDLDALIDNALSELVAEPTEEVDEVQEIGSEVEETEEDTEVVEETDAADPTDEEDDGSEGGDDEGDEESDTEVLELDPEAVVRIDGKVVKVKDALELKADYTRKTQALAEERKEFETEIVEVQDRLTYIEQLENTWEDDPVKVVAGFAAASEDPEEVLAESFLRLAEAQSVDPNLALVKTMMLLVSGDYIDDELKEMFGFTEDVVSRVKSQVKSQERLTKVERKLAAEERKASAAAEAAASSQKHEQEVSAHFNELTQQWDRIIASNPEVSSLRAEEQRALKVELVQYAIDNGGIPLTVAYDALEAKRLKAASAKRAADAAVKQKKSNASRVVSKPSASAPSPAPRKSGDLDAAIAEAIAEVEARKRAN